MPSSSELAPEAAKFLPDLHKDFEFSQEEVNCGPDKRSVYEFTGGEDYGLKRVEEFIYS